jgi:hypothetical protein
MPYSLTLGYTGDTRTYRVPDRVRNGTIDYTLVGGGGGGGGADAAGRGGDGTSGSIVSGRITVQGGDLIEVAVGGGGSRGRTGVRGTGGAGGQSFSEFVGGDGGGAAPIGVSGSGGGGGGATVIKVNGYPVAVAGGGGGGAGGSFQSHVTETVRRSGGSKNTKGQIGGYYEGDGGGGGGGGGGVIGGSGGAAGADYNFSSRKATCGAMGTSRGSTIFPNGDDVKTTNRVNSTAGYGGSGATANDLVRTLVAEYIKFPTHSDYRWGSHMNSYAVWGDHQKTPTFESTVVNVQFPGGPVTFQISADNYGEVRIDGSKVVSTTTFTGSATKTLTIDAGKHEITLSGYNVGSVSSGNPAGISVSIHKGKSASGVPFWHSRQRHISSFVEQTTGGQANDNATDGNAGLAEMVFNLTPRDILEKDGSNWKRVKEVYVKESGVWKPCADVFVKDGREWIKSFYRGDFTVSFSSTSSGFGGPGYAGVIYSYLTPIVIAPPPEPTNPVITVPPSPQITANISGPSESGNGEDQFNLSRPGPDAGEYNYTVTASNGAQINEFSGNLATGKLYNGKNPIRAAINLRTPHPATTVTFRISRNGYTDFVESVSVRERNIVVVPEPPVVVTPVYDEIIDIPSVLEVGQSFTVGVTGGAPSTGFTFTWRNARTNELFSSGSGTLDGSGNFTSGSGNFTYDSSFVLTVVFAGSGNVKTASVTVAPVPVETFDESVQIIGEYQVGQVPTFRITGGKANTSFNFDWEKVRNENQTGSGSGTLDANGAFEGTGGISSPFESADLYRISVGFAGSGNVKTADIMVGEPPVVVVTFDQYLNTIDYREER